MTGSRIVISGPWVLRSITLIAVALFGLHVVAEISTLFLGYENLGGFVPLFDMGRERNAPTLFSTALFVINACLFAIVAMDESARDGSRWAWNLLAAVFCFLALDEFVEIHERLIVPVRTLLNTSGLLYFAWLIPYVIAVVLLATLVGPTVFRTHARVRNRLILSAVTYLTGAVGFEALGGRVADRLGALPTRTDVTYQVLVTLEESFEVAGLLLLSWALLTLLSQRNEAIQVELGGR